MATMCLWRYPFRQRAIIFILLQSQAGGLGYNSVDKSHQGVTLRKDLCVLTETTLLNVCSVLIREMGLKGSPVAVKKREKTLIGLENAQDWLLRFGWNTVSIWPKPSKTFFYLIVWADQGGGCLDESMKVRGIWTKGCFFHVLFSKLWLVWIRAKEFILGQKVFQVLIVVAAIPVNLWIKLIFYYVEV